MQSRSHMKNKFFNSFFVSLEKQGNQWLSLKTVEYVLITSFCADGSVVYYMYDVSNEPLTK